MGAGSPVRFAAGEYRGPEARTNRGPQNDKKDGGTLVGFLRLVLVALIPLCAQVFPLGIHRDDQRDFLDSQPSLDLLFALDGVAYVVKAFEVRQAVDLIFRGEAGAGSAFLFLRSAYETVCNSGVKGFRAVRHDVDEVGFLRVRVGIGCRFEHAKGWRARL
jgi:hypothetical protein